jgi:lipopolysaccharide biosynthesis glycosyltransferase
MTDTAIHVACAADEAYAPHCAAMLHSLISCQRASDVHIHFLHHPRLSSSVIERLRLMVVTLGAEIRFHPIADHTVAGLPEMGRISSVMWYRAFLPELLPNLDRILYLDCDTIVMDDLHLLWETDLDGYLLGAVKNVFERDVAGRAHDLGLAGPEQYFNSGVLLLNLGEWRREDCSRRLLDYARANASRLVWPDQDALNVIMARRWYSLHPRWNSQNSLFYFVHARTVFGDQMVREATQQPGILHFEGGELAKPWHYLCKHPFRQEYYRHLRATPFPVLPPEGRTLRNGMLRLLPMRALPSVLKFIHRAESALQRRFARIFANP